jgi:hypothetical protein
VKVGEYTVGSVDAVFSDVLPNLVEVRERLRWKA